MKGLTKILGFTIDVVKFSFSSKNLKPYSEFNYSSNIRVLPSAVKMLPGLAFYDLYHDAKTANKDDRKLAGKLTSDFVILTDMVDDYLDKNAQMSIKKRFKYMDDVFDVLFGYETSLDKSSPVDYEAYELAKSLRQNLTIKDTTKSIEKSFIKIVNSAKKQFEVSDPDEAIEIVNNIGGLCTRACSELVGVISSEQNERVNQIAQYLGEYCELLDNAYEIDNDIEEGVNTYATLRIRQEGDSKEIRKDIQRKLREIASKSFEGAKNHVINNEELNLVYAVKLMVDFKYRLLGKFVK